MLYPEVALAGSLAGAVEAAAVAQGLTLVVPPSTSLDSLVVSGSLPQRGDLWVSAAEAERSWQVVGCQEYRQRPLVAGCTTVLAALARAVAAWQAGASMEELVAAAPFLRSTGRLDVPGADPARMVASEWQRLLTAAAEGDREIDLALLEAVHADPLLRQLYPFTSVWRLRLSTSVLGFRCPLPWALPTGSGSYEVVSPGHVVIGVVDTVEEAVAVIRGWLADDDVPAVPGPDPRPVRDPLREEAERRFDAAGDEPWFRVERATAVEDWQRLFDLFAQARPDGGRRWQYAEGGVERDLPATAADVFARPPGAPPATVRQVFRPDDCCPITFHPVTPDEICFTVDLRCATPRRFRAFWGSMEDVASVQFSGWILVAPQGDREHPVLAVAPVGVRLL